MSMDRHAPIFKNYFVKVGNYSQECSFTEREDNLIIQFYKN